MLDPKFSSKYTILKSMFLLLLLSLIIGCSNDIDYYTETYTQKIPMGGDSVLSYQAHVDYKSVTSPTFYSPFGGGMGGGTSGETIRYRIGMSVDYCVEVGGVQKSCVKGIPYSPLTLLPLISTYEKGVYLLDYEADEKELNGLKFVQKIWNWETNQYMVDTLRQTEPILKIDQTVKVPTADYNLLTVALTDSGYFLRLRKGMNLTYGDSYVQVNSTNKTIQNASMDSVEIVERNGWKHKVPKCKLGQWSYGGGKICGIQDDSYSLSTAKAAVILNDSTILNCPGGWGGGFFRFFYTNKITIKPINIRNLTSDLNDVGREYFKQDGECQ